MKRLFLLSFSVLWFLSLSAEKVNNPFAQFVGQRYGTYHYALRDSLRLRYDSNNYAYTLRTVKQLRSLPDALHNHQWSMEADFLEANFVHDYRQGNNTVFLNRMNRLLIESQEYDNKVFELRILRRLFDFYGRSNIFQAIVCARQMEKLITQITPRDYPDVADCMFVLAEMYLGNKDYQRAEKNFKKITTMPIADENQRIFVLARNDLGIIMRDYYHQLDLSDHWFRSIIAFDRQYRIKELRNQWIAIVQGELGRNLFLRHRFVEALPPMKMSFETMFREADYTFSFNMASTLADCYCQLKRYADARRYISLADTCRHRPNYIISLQPFYVAKSKYYTGTNDATEASLYLDSVIIAQNETQRRHNMNPFLQMEQQMGQYELQQEAAKSQANFRLFLVILIVSIIFAILCISYMILFFQKRNAYRALVLKNQQWAAEKNIRQTPVTTVEKQTTNDNDDKFCREIEEYLEKTQCYCLSDLSLESLSKMIGINRSYLSAAINRMNSNFYSLINKHRIGYAIRLLTEDKNRNLEDLAFTVGYNNRKSFYNAFCAVTGLSPTQFRKNIKTNEQQHNAIRAEIPSV